MKEQNYAQAQFVIILGKNFIFKFKFSMSCETGDPDACLTCYPTSQRDHDPVAKTCNCKTNY